MEYRTLGGTGLKVSALSFGGSPLGGVYGEVDVEECRRTMHAALDSGINLIDVSPYYGETRAETMLGDVLKGVARDRYLIATKVGRYGNSDFDFSAERVMRSAEKSMGRIGVEHIDILQCHDIEYGSIDQIVNETLPALNKLKEQGKVGFVGVTGLPLEIFTSVLDRATIDVILSYCRCTLLDDTLTALIPYLKQKNVGIISASPLAMGLLGGSPPPWHPASPAMREAVAAASAHCRERGADLAQLAVQYALANPNIATTLVGISNQRELERSLACVGTLPDPELLTQVEAILAPVHNQTWQSKSSL